MGALRVIECDFLIDGNCEIASRLAGIPCKAFDSNCNHCKATATHESPSAASIGLAIAASAAAGDKAKFNELVALQVKLGNVARVEAKPRGIQIAADLPPIEQGAGELACAERGEQLRLHTCTSCGLRGVEVPVYRCKKFGTECTVMTTELTQYRKQVAGESTVRSCTLCDGDGERVPPSLKAEEWRKARCAYLADPSHWAGRYAGGTLFLCGAGPSLAETDWSVFPWRGAMTLAINNAGAVGPRHDLWIATDDAGKFAVEIWRDRSLAKFTPQRRLSNHLRARVGDEWHVLEETPGIMPNVHPILRAGVAFDAPTFFTSRTLQLGQRIPGAGDKPDSLARKSTMLYALRLAVDLGFKTINILGADFSMSPDRSYAFDEVKPDSGITTSNLTFQFLNIAFRELRPILDSLGVKVWNCTPGGNLEAFPRRSYAEAVAEAAPIKTETFSGIYAWPPRFKLAVVTCTADRLRAFELLKTYMARQVDKPATWIVADSGRERVSLEGFPYARHLELDWSDDPWRSFQTAMVKGIDAALEAGATAIAFFEDDDFYAPAFLQAGLKALNDGVTLWGDREARKWNADAGRVSVKRYREHAATAQTMMTADVARIMRDMIEVDPHNADLRIWDRIKSRKRLDTGLGLHASIKGLYPVALTWGHNPRTLNEEWKPDAEGAELAKWLGADARAYKAWFDDVPAQVGA